MIGCTNFELETITVLQVSQQNSSTTLQNYQLKYKTSNLCFNEQSQYPNEINSAQHVHKCYSPLYDDNILHTTKVSFTLRKCQVNKADESIQQTNIIH